MSLMQIPAQDLGRLLLRELPQEGQGWASSGAAPLEHWQGGEAPESRAQSPKQHTNPALLSKLCFFPSYICFLSRLRRCDFDDI